MHKAEKHLQFLIQEFLRWLQPKGIKLDADQDLSLGEGYKASYGGRFIALRYGSFAAGIFAINQLALGFKSGHFPDFLGERKPVFVLRPLALQSNLSFQTFPETEFYFPKALLKNRFPDLEKVDLFCKRTLEFGFNSVLFGCFFSEENGLKEQLGFEETRLFDKAFELIKSYGLKLIIKPKASKIATGIFDKLPSFDYLFWESQPLISSDSTLLADRVFTEIKLLESALQNKPLIYYIPSEQNNESHWMLRICDDVAKGTIISFPVVNGPFASDYLPLHPFWESLRKTQHESATQLMPVWNAGGLKHGEGLWPLIPVDAMESGINNCSRHRYAGFLTIVNQIPGREGFLDAALSMGAIIQWEGKAFNRYLESWFLSNRPDIDYLKNKWVFRESREIAKKLHQLNCLSEAETHETLSSEECRSLIDSLLARLKDIQVKLIKSESKRIKPASCPTLYDYFQLFERDARRMILRFLQSSNSGLANLLGSEEIQESFWTEFNRLESKGGSKVAILREPKKGEAGSRMEQIYLENRLL